MISNAKETSLNEDKDYGGMEDPKGKIEKVSNTEGTKVKDGFLWKIMGKISIEPVVILMNLGWTMYWVQTANLYIEKTCKVGSFFFGNGTTFSNEVLFISQNFLTHVISSVLHIICEGMRQPFQWNLFGGARICADGGGQRRDGLQLDQTGE